MSVRYSAGIATAYGAAVRGGYTGTYEQFCADLAALPGVVETLENITASASTLPAGSSATASYSNGAFSFGIPKGDTGATGATGQTGATGNGIANIEKTGTSGLVDTYTITYTNGNTTTFDVTNGEVTQAEFLTAFPHDSVSGSLVTIPDGADSIPVRDLVVAIEPIQTGSGDPSPDNIRPISGWTGCKLYRTGKNLLDPSTFDFDHVTVSDGVYTLSKTGYNVCLQTGQSGNSYTISSSDYAKIQYLHAGSYVLSYKLTSGSSFNKIYKVNPDGTYIGESLTQIESGEYYAFGFTLNVGTKVAIIRASNTNPTVFSEIMIEKGTVRTAYEPYTGTSYPVSWSDDAGTVYGGTWNPTTGKLTANYGYRSLTGLTWGKNSSSEVAFEALCTEITTKANGVSNLRSDYFKNITSNQINVSEYTIRGFSSSSSIAIKVPISVASSYTEFKNWIDQQNAHLCYELATPIEYTLTEQQITTHLGLNNLWADTGDVSLDYRADPTLYIQRLTGSAEDDMVANQNIASGKYFMVGTNLYYSTASIANGDAIVVGTNCSALTLADALNALNV